MNESTTGTGLSPFPVKCRVTSGSRLHLGLLNTREPFGGVGLMVSIPQTIVEAEFNPVLSDTIIEGPGADRVEEIVARVQAGLSISHGNSIRVIVKERPRPHSGLGTGTQLAMATAEAVTICYGIQVSETDLAIQIAQRGKRSAVGIHGYFNGGLLVERVAKQGIQPLHNLERRWELPVQWRIALFSPRNIQAQVCGNRESQFFSDLPEPSLSKRLKVEQVLENSLVPAADRQDFCAFCEAVYEYNQLSGSYFESIQGGAYNGPEIANLVAYLRSIGIRGVGQSSWGPTVFAFFKSEDAFHEANVKLPTGWHRYALAAPLNRGRTIEVGSAIP